MRIEILEADLRAVSPYGNAKIIHSLAEQINPVLQHYKIDTPARIAHFLAQAAHETAGFNTLHEYGTKAYFEKRYGHRRDLGNLSKRDGSLFRGRGIFQLTGRYNYRRYGEKIGAPLEARPAMAADPRVSLVIACEYWSAHRLNELADRGKFKSITRKINGGTNGLLDRKRYLQRAWQRLGSGPLPIDAGKPGLVDEGDSGPLVVQLQQHLAELGYHTGANDGHFGPLTRRALIAFQSENGLKADGIAGPKTEEALQSAEKPEPAAREATTVEDLREAGSTTIQNADTVKTIAGAATAVGAVKGAVDTGALQIVENLTGSINEVKAVVTPLIDAVTWMSSSLWITLIAGGLLAWLYAGRIIKARLADHISGKHLGR